MGGGLRRGHGRADAAGLALVAVPAGGYVALRPHGGGDRRPVRRRRLHRPVGRAVADALGPALGHRHRSLSRRGLFAAELLCGPAVLGPGQRHPRRPACAGGRAGRPLPPDPCRLQRCAGRPCPGGLRPARLRRADGAGPCLDRGGLVDPAAGHRLDRGPAGYPLAAPRRLGGGRAGAGAAVAGTLGRRFPGNRDAGVQLDPLWLRHSLRGVHPRRLAVPQARRRPAGAS